MFYTFHFASGQRLEIILALSLLTEHFLLETQLYTNSITTLYI